MHDKADEAPSCHVQVARLLAETNWRLVDWPEIISGQSEKLHIAAYFHVVPLSLLPFLAGRPTTACRD